LPAWKTALADHTAGKQWSFKQAAGGVLAAKQAPTGPALPARRDLTGSVVENVL
jgi:hypothetical protein